MVRFIAGKANLNISAAVRGEMISLLEKSAEKQNIIFIVPDQFEYETEKAVYRILDEKGLLNRFYEIRITTFSRLCREILAECGEHRPFADDIVKNIVMHKSVNENKTALAALNKIAARPGFCGKMVRTVSALKTSGVTSRDLELSLNAITGGGKRDEKISPDMPVIKKLYETNLLYTNYEALLSDYIDKLDVTALAADHIASGASKAFDGANVFVDCFNDFTHSQLEFLKQVILKAEDVTFGFTTGLNSSCDVFRTANAHIVRLKSEALENGITVELVTEEIESRYAEGCPLEGVAKHLFQTMKNCEPLGDSCELVSAAGVYEELDYAAAKIKELTIDKGLRYGEIAVLCTDVGAYGKHVESAFKKYDIPVFLDTPEPILYQPLINLVISILNALESFNVDTVLSCVKSKFFAKPKTASDNSDNGESEDKKDKFITLSDKDIDIFENYIYEWDLKTSHLKKEFAFKDKDSKNDSSVKTAELVRQCVAVPILELQKKLKKSGNAINGAEMTELLYDFLINKVGMRRAIYKRCKNEENTVLDQDRVDLYQRLWNSLIDIFDKLHAELSDTNLTIGEYGEIFRDICASTTLANPPQFIDCVLVGDIDRTRADNIKAAFIVGASYEAFPTPAFEAGIFSQYEIELIYDKIVHIDKDMPSEDVSKYIENIARIADTGRREYCLSSVQDRYYLSLYRAYRAVTLPTEYLCISCPEVDAAGESTGRSDIFGEFSSTFKDFSIISADSRGNEFYCRTPRAAKMRYAMGSNGNSDENAVLRKVLEREDGEFVKALDEIREMRSDVPLGKTSDGKFSGKHSLERDTARLLFFNRVNATAIEKLNLCKFNYFCTYGLKIDERNKRSFTRSKRGEAIHYVFQHILEEYSGDMDAFFALRRGELLSLSKKYLAEYRELKTNNDSTEDKRTEYLFNNIASSATDVLITMQTELFARKYRPKFFELRLMSDQKTDRWDIIDNESAPTSEPPEAEIFGTEEDVANTPNEARCSENAPYLITKPLVIKLDKDTEITVQGIVDRVDMFNADISEDGKPVAYIRVVDYKSSVHTFDLNIAQNGVNIQMLLYLFALQSANKDNPTLSLRPGGVSYVPSKNYGASKDETSPYRLLAMNYHESGLFIRDEVTEKDLEGYKNAVFSKLDSDGSITPKELQKIKASFEPTEFNLAEAEHFKNLREDIMKKVTENLGAIFDGVINALPLEHYEEGSSDPKNPCEYCRFGDICRNAGKNVIKIPKTKLKPKKPKKDDNTVYWNNKYITQPEPEPKSGKKSNKEDGGNG